MPAKSIAQQHFMGMVHAYKQGKLKHASSEIKKAAASISDEDVMDFAATKTKKLPQTVEDEEKTHWLHGKAPKKGTLRYDIWKDKVEADMKSKEWYPDDEMVGTAKVIRPKKTDESEDHLSFKEFLIQEQSGE